MHGELDLEGAPELRRALIEAIDEQPGRQLVVDLEGVDFIDSAGLGVLVGGLKRARTARATSCWWRPAERYQGARADRAHPRVRDPPVARGGARRPRVSVAFVLGGGGGPLGAHEVGMLCALIERGIRADLVLGTSVGAINGAAVAADPSVAGVERLTDMWSAIDRTDVLGGSVFGRLATLARTRTHLHDNQRCARC